MVYLLHFNTPLAHAKHYLGFADNLPQRLEAHKNGTGARLMEVVSDAGIKWELARTWEGDRKTEKALKRQKNSPRLCPICSGGSIEQSNNDELNF